MHLVFDIYGTLLDVDAAARQAAAENSLLAEHWQDISKSWRQRQLNYSWLYSLMGKYEPFWHITEKALDTTLFDIGGELKDNLDLRNTLLNLYLELPPYDEVIAVLSELRSSGHELGVLSNGNPEMLMQSLDSAGISNFFTHVLSVETIEIYKPSPQTYSLVLDAFGCKASSVQFFSSNYWDIAGASSFGFETFWLNRKAETWEALPARYSHEVRSLREAIAFLQS